VLKGDKVTAATAKGLLAVEDGDAVTSYGWAPFNGPNGQVRVGGTRRRMRGAQWRTCGPHRRPGPAPSQLSQAACCCHRRGRLKSAASHPRTPPHVGPALPRHTPQSLLGQVDLAFLAAYAIGMFVAGHIGDRTDLRVFLSGGMVLSGLLTSLFGMVRARRRAGRAAAGSGGRAAAPLN
jgi:hypothetical protein